MGSKRRVVVNIAIRVDTALPATLGLIADHE